MKDTAVLSVYFAFLFKMDFSQMNVSGPVFVLLVTTALVAFVYKKTLP